MHRIDGQGHVANQFTPGDPVSGQEATEVTAAWLNAVQEEACNVITGAGLALNKADNTQLRQAMAIMTGGPGRLLPDPYLKDEQEPAENDAQRGAIKFKAGADAWCWNQIEIWRPGVDQRVGCEIMASLAQVATMDWRLAYLLVPAGGANPVVKKRWKASTGFAVGDQVIPLGTHLNGRYYQCATAGTSGAVQPAWGTAVGGNTNDGTVVWTCKDGGFKPLTLSFTPPNAAWQRFNIDNAALTIPAAEATAGARLHLGLWRRGSGDPHGGDLLLVNARLVPVGV